MVLEITEKNMNELDNFEPSNTSTFGKFLEWIHSWINTLRENINSDRNDMENAVVFGTYTGNGNADRFISLGFTPVAVEVYAGDGGQYDSSGSSREYFGGLALKSYPCQYDGTNGNFYIIKIDGNGFYVTCAKSSNRAEDINSNINGEVYYFKAYRYGKINNYE